MFFSRSTPQTPVDGGDLERVDSFQWPAGHIGHITEGQKLALQKFKSLCEEAGYYTPGDEKTSPSHDDETLLRFLRARKFIAQDAFRQFTTTEDWRKENNMNTLYERIDVDEYESTRRLYPQWTGRTDKHGIPIFVYELAHLNMKDVTANDNNQAPPVETNLSRKMLRLCALHESLLRFVLPLCSANPKRSHLETPVSQNTNIVDIGKVGLMQFWNLKNHLQESTSLSTSHYPETLDRIFVVGAPSFLPTIWAWAKRWLDPITVAKITFLTQTNTFSVLSEYIEVENIPKKFGGELDWDFGDMPMLDQAIADSVQWKEEMKFKNHRTLPIGPIKWKADKNGDLQATATGVLNGEQRAQHIAALHPEPHVALLALTPGRNDNDQSTSLAPVADAERKSAEPATIAEKPAVVAATSETPSTADTPTTATTTTATAPPAVVGSAIDAGEAVPVPPTHPIMSGDANLDIGKSEGSSLQETSRAGTYTVPYRDHDNEVHSPPLDGRQGTSATRFEQQSGTHAAGTLENGTPETRQDGQGSEHAVMEPRTVGQAPKETPLVREGEHAPTLVEQAQQLAEQAVETAKQVPATVLSAVGMGAKPEENGAPPKAEDPRVDGMDAAKVEEFIRAKTMSKPDTGVH